MPPRTRQRRGRYLSSAEEEGGRAKTSATCSEKSGQKRRAQMAAETVGGQEQGGEGDAGRPDSEIFAKLDPRVLDCIICSEPLRPPIFQCEVGHVLCFVCRGKLRSNLCPTCFQAIGFNRCFAIEQMADAVKVPCSNSNFGCDEYITSQKMVAHLKDQRHRFSITLSPSTNGLRQTSIMTKAQRISIPRHSRFVLLVGEDQSMFLMVNTCVHIGNALTTVCIRPHESGSCYSSKISDVHHAEGVVGRYLFQMDPHVSSSSLHGGVQLGSRFFLLVPRDLVDESTDELTINISIEKIKCAAHQ